jgi:hypothetical protein
MTPRQHTLLGALEACAFLALYIWVRWYSGFWRYGWVGLCLGAVLGLMALQGIALQQALAVRHDIPKRAYVIGAIVFFFLGVETLKHFFTTPTADNAFFGLLILVLSLQQAIIAVRLFRPGHRGAVAAHANHINHG